MFSCSDDTLYNTHVFTAINIHPSLTCAGGARGNGPEFQG